MRVTPQEALALAGGLIGLVGFMDSAIQRYNRATTAKYAAERDFGHLKRNQEQIKEAIKLIDEENEALKIELTILRTEIRTLLKYMDEQQ